MVWNNTWNYGKVGETLWPEASPIVKGKRTAMHSTDPSDHESAVRRLKEEMDSLTKKQSEAIQRATYLGMTADEAKEYDSRRDQILKLAEQFHQLKKAL